MVHPAPPIQQTPSVEENKQPSVTTANTASPAASGGKRGKERNDR